jgi:hypothetical protein
VLTAAATWVELEVSVDPVAVNLVELEVGVDRIVSVVVLVDTAAVTLVVLEVVLKMVEVEEIGEDSAPPVCAVVSPLLVT